MVLPVLRLNKFGGTLLEGLLGILFPSYCLGCGVRLRQNEEPLCRHCLQGMERADNTVVAARVATLPDPGAIDEVFSLWLYKKDSVIQNVQHRLKYGNRPWYGPVLGRQMGAAYRMVSQTLLDAIIPVPLHRARLYERGYNQSMMLAIGLHETLGVPVYDDVLFRVRATRSQTRLSRYERWVNVSGAFLVEQPDLVYQRRIMLVDDLLTTGATAAAAAFTLKQAGADYITLVTLGFADI